MHRHGWDTNQHFSDKFLKAMYALHTDANTSNPKSPTHSNHSQDDDSDTNKFTRSPEQLTVKSGNCYTIQECRI